MVNFFFEENGSSPGSNEQERVPEPESLDGQMESTIPELKETTSQKNVVSLTLQTRAATAAALAAAAAAHAKLLADQEERKIEQTVATIIETQLKKLQSKAKHLDELEQILEKEHVQIEGLEEHLITERISILEEIFRSGIPRSKDNIAVKLPMGNNVPPLILFEIVDLVV